MTIYNKLTIDGTEYIDFKNVTINRTQDEANACSTIRIKLDSPFGRHKSDFQIGEEIVFYSNSYPCPDNQLVSYWKLDETSGSVLDSVGSNNGTNSSGTTNQTGKINTCYYFDSGSYIYVPDNSTLNPTSQISVGFWFKASDLSKLAGTMLSKWTTGAGSNNSYAVIAYPSTNLIEFAIEQSNNAVVTNQQSYTFDTNWHYFTGIADGKNIKVYIDGVQLGSNLAYDGTLKSTTKKVCIGRLREEDTTYYFKGYIDEVGIWNRGLNTDEISSLYNLGSGRAYPFRTKIFVGVTEKIVFSGEGTSQTCEIEGRDYSLRLMDMTIKPIVYTNTEVSAIVKDIITSNQIPDITTNNVQTTSTTLKRISFAQTPAFDGISQLAQLASTEGFIFYVDNDKDLHFEPRTTSSSGYTLDNSNLLNLEFDKSRQGMSNIVYVYGDRYLSEAPNEKFTIGSPWGLGSSIVTLNYKPHNTKVSYLGSVMKGSVEGMTILPTSGTDYGVSFDDKQIIFYSGTDFPSFPASGGSVVIAYDRDLPIIKQEQNDLSILLYGPKELKIQDNSIKDPATATAILKQKLTDSDPLDRISCEVLGWLNVTPGQTIDINLTDFNLVDTLNIVRINYNFTPETIQKGNVITLEIGNKFIDITDKIKEYKSAIDRLNSQNLQDSDVISRLISTTGSFVILGSNWNVYSRSIAGSTLIYDSPYFGVYNTQAYGGGSLVTSFILGTTALIGLVGLGTRTSTYQLVFSGT